METFAEKMHYYGKKKSMGQIFYNGAITIIVFH